MITTRDDFIAEPYMSEIKIVGDLLNDWTKREVLKRNSICNALRQEHI